MKASLTFLALLAMALAGPAGARDTKTYIYDAQGRLTVVGRSQSGGTGTTTYTYDNANNRTYRTITAPSPGGGQAALNAPSPADRASVPAASQPRFVQVTDSEREPCARETEATECQ